MFRIDFFDEVSLEFFYHIVFVLMGSLYRGGSRTAATSKVKRFVIIVNGWKPLTIITKRSILNVAAVLDPPLRLSDFYATQYLKFCNINISVKRSIEFVSII